MVQIDRVGRKTHVVECRATSGTAIGGNLAFPGTLSEAEHPDIIVLAMSPSSRHITKPVCQITYSLREAGLNVSVLVLSSGTGTSSEMAPRNTVGASIMSITEKERHQISLHKIVMIHVGNVPSHFIPKIKEILMNVDTPAIVLSQAPITFSDLASNGIRVLDSSIVEQNPETSGQVIDLVNGIVRGQRCTQHKIEEIVTKARKAMQSVVFD